MANDNNIQLDVELNRASVSKAWADLENSAAKSAKDSAAVFEKAFSKVEAPKVAPQVDKKSSFMAIQSMTDIASSVYLIKEALDVVARVGKFAIETVLAGEAVFKAEARFEALGAQVGVVASLMSNELVKATKNFVDDTELLSLASESFIRIGSAAEKLPKVLEAARKSYAVFGGDIVTNANKIVSAVETGNKRTLKDIGLYVNLEAAVKKYARQLGTVPALLSEQQKQQARLNAVLEVSEARFANVQEKAGPTSAYKQLGTSLNDLYDSFAKLADSKLGKALAVTFELAAEAAREISQALKDKLPVKTVEDMTARIASLREQEQKYAGVLAKEVTPSLFDNHDVMKAQLLTVREQIAAYDEIRRKLSNYQAQQAAAPKAAVDEDPAVVEERLRRRADIAAKLVDLNAQVNQSEIVLLQADYAREATRAGLEELGYAQRLAAVTQYETEKAALAKLFLDNGTASQAEQHAAFESLELKHVNTMLAIRQKYTQDLKALTNETSADILSTSQAFAAVMAGIRQELSFQTGSMKASLKDLGKAFVTTFKSQATNAIFAFAQGTKSAGEAAQGLFTGILNAMGEMLISQGLGFVLQGAAFAWAGLPNGAALAAAGGAMIAFGATLAAVSAANGGAVGASGGGGSTGGAGADSTYRDRDPQKPVADLLPQNPNTTINVNLDKVFDRKETGLWIADILTDTFEQNGVVVRTNA